MGQREQPNNREELVGYSSDRNGMSHPKLHFELLGLERKGVEQNVATAQDRGRDLAVVLKVCFRQSLLQGVGCFSFLRRL